MSGPTPPTPPSHPTRFAPAAAAVLTLGLVVLLLWHFHDRFWYPSDEGIYANIAERLLSGEVLGRDVQDLHPGYGDFLNAAAMWLFGVDLLSLRYPLVLTAVLQSMLVFAFLVRRGAVLAAAGSIAVAAIGVVQFLNPTPHWYCAFFLVAIACWMKWVPPERAARLVGAGVLVGVAALFRQLSGVWIAMGVVTVALLEQAPRSSRRGWLAPALLTTMALAIALYVAKSREVDGGGLVLFAAWPMAILVSAVARVRIPNDQAVKMLAQLSAGAAAAALPLFVYGIVHGSLGAWADDNVMAAFTLADLAFFHGGWWYGALPVAGLHQALTAFDLSKSLNGIYWTVLPLLAATNGLLVLRRLGTPGDRSTLALPVLAAFYGLVSLFMQDAIYLHFTAGLSLVAVLAQIASSGPRVRVAWTALTMLVSVVGVVFHAAQPATRTSSELLEGARTTKTWTKGPIMRCSLRVDPDERGQYERLVALITREVPPNEAIAALPSDAALYFLSNRRNPFRFYNSSFGIRGAADLKGASETFSRARPRIVTFRPEDKYNTDASRALMQQVRLGYDLVETIAGVEVYRLR